MLALRIALIAAGAGLTFPLDHVAIQEALTIANSSMEADHRRFHADYQILPASPPVDVVSIVTPFRRVVLTAETEARLGRSRFGQREALAALQPDPDRVEVYAELTFHPHHTFLAVPEYGIVLEPAPPARPAVVPESIVRLPRFAPRVETPWYPYSYPFRAPGLPARADSLLGGTLVAGFAAAQLDPQGAYSLRVMDGTRALAQARLDLRRLR